MAPYDFGILKSPQELNADLARVDSLFPNQYIKDTGQIHRTIEAFKTDYQSVLKGLPEEIKSSRAGTEHLYVEEGMKLLRSLDSIGVYKEADLASPKDSTKMTVISGNKSFRIDPVSIAQAKGFVRSRLSEASIKEASILDPIISRHIKENIRFDPELTLRLRKIETDRIALTKGKITRGQLIISKDAVITAEMKRILDSYKAAHIHTVSEGKSQGAIFSGYLLLTSLLITVFSFLIYQWSQNDTEFTINKFLLILLTVVVFSFVSFLVDSNGTLSLYLVPYCIAPIVLKTFFDDRTAFCTYVVMIVSIALLLSLGFEYIFLQILAGLVALSTNKVTRYWTPFFRSILLIACTYIVAFLSLTIIKEGDFRNFDWMNIRWFLVNAFMLLLAYPLVPLLERLFGFTSAITLAELADLNKPLLKELSLKAPGTFQHSLAVANIAEAAADAIGADALLLRVSALYHDIGKVEKPTYFIENQVDENPHKNLTPQESAEIIIEHVNLGVKKAKKHGLPKQVIELIRTHHGTTRVEYFYNAVPGSLQRDDTGFRYPGPAPRTKEEVLLMLADSVEASCKSLSKPTLENIDQMVDKIISKKITNHQLDNGALTFKELETARKSFKKVLHGIYHVRIEYPEDEQSN